MTPPTFGRPVHVVSLLLAIAGLLLLIELKIYTHMISGIVGSLLLAFGTLVLFRGHWTVATLMDTAFQVSSFGEGESSELYVVNLSGAVYRFDPT